MCKTCKFRKIIKKWLKSHFFGKNLNKSLTNAQKLVILYEHDYWDIAKR